jgi:excisionase family DNA binding protein
MNMHKRKTETLSDASLALSVEETAWQMRVGVTTVYSIIAAKQLPARKIGRRTIILREDIERYLRSLGTQA